MRVLNGSDVARLLDMEACIQEVENAFRARGEGRRATSAVAGLELTGGGLHAKLGALDISRGYAAAKINANFPENPARRSLPTIQGVLVLFDASSGVPLACMDSATITATRTAAASAVAARHLALPKASSVAFIGCGTQARAHFSALCLVRPITSVSAFDAERGAAERFAAELKNDRGLEVASENSGDVDYLTACGARCRGCQRRYVHRGSWSRQRAQAGDIAWVAARGGGHSR
jgi:alanine dehydrogenase